MTYFKLIQEQVWYSCGIWRLYYHFHSNAERKNNRLNCHRRFDNMEKRGRIWV